MGSHKTVSKITYTCMFQPWNLTLDPMTKEKNYLQHSTQTTGPQTKPSTHFVPHETII
jgi:hypothetical protein